MSKIMVIDDQDIMRESLEETLKRCGHEVKGFSRGTVALKDFSRSNYDMVITDLRMPEIDGVQILAKVKESASDVPVVVITAYGTIENAVESMKLGAFDYILKPFQAEQIEMVVNRALEHQKLVRENEYLKRELETVEKDGCLVGTSDALKDLKQQIAQIADSSATVLIKGPSGTGKELVARAIHHTSSRRDKPLVAVNCAALSAGLLESELFGHEKGAFTGADKMRKGRFELADDGTILLDEISEIDLNLQPKLLRVLQEQQFERVGSSVSRTVDVRVLATTNRNLEREMQECRFRRDLYFRLNVIPIEVPPLSRHTEDIPELVDYFLAEFAARDGAHPRTLDKAALDLLMRYDWPGNVRELKNIVERAFVLSKDGVIRAEQIAPWLVESTSDEGDLDSFVGKSLEYMEKILIEKTLAQHDGHRAKSAAALGIGLRTLTNKIKKYDLS